MADTEERAEVDEAEIAAHWKEEEWIHPSESFVAQANMADEAVLERFAQDKFPESFREYADLLDWDEPWHTTLDSSNPPFWNWFVGGKLNASYNCVDRHLEKNRNKAAFIFVPEDEGEVDQVITYQDLYVRVNEFAALLQDFCGLKAGDRVTLHMPMTPELPVVMLACARIGVIHSQVFGGFSGTACGERIVDSESHVLITTDAYWRSGKLLDHKEKADEAVAKAAESGVVVDKVLVWRRYPGKVSAATPMVGGRDFYVDELMKDYKGRRVAPLSMSSDAPLFLMYTSGTTAKPKGCQHSTGGYLAYAAGTAKYYQDIHPEDVYWCMADIGWITGHSYIVYGPLANGATTVMYEGAPNWPDEGRFWNIVEKYKVSIFYTAPTAIRAFIKWGDDWPGQADLSSLRLLGTVGEPINPEAWMWYRKVIGAEKCPIVDTWWQTETGCIMLSPLPGVTTTKPGSCTMPLPGVVPDIVTKDGESLDDNLGGLLVLKQPWPSMLRTLYGDHDRFLETYFSEIPGSYFAGDGARRDEDGCYWIMGRVDDVLNVAGHRLSTMEIESALVSHPQVAEAAVVGFPHELKGEGICCFVTMTVQDQSEELKAELIAHVREQIGAIATPDKIRFAAAVPKTRSGKIMRRLLRDIAAGREEVGDTTTLEDYTVLASLRDDE